MKKLLVSIAVAASATLPVFAALDSDCVLLNSLGQDDLSSL